MKLSAMLSGGIVQGVRAASGLEYLQVSGPTGSCWFSVSEFTANEKAVRIRLAEEAGLKTVTPQSLTELRAQVQNWAEFKEGQVAEYTGWTGCSFACGDRSILTTHDDDNFLVTFPATDKFSPAGDLEQWQQAVGPFISGQPLPLFVLAFALSGPILSMVPSGIVNPHMELVGERESGKSTLGCFAASVWAGNPDAAEGGGETWEMTPGFFDNHRTQHRDMFLLLDEGESVTNERARQEIAKSIAFKGAATAVKKRLTDTKAAPAIRVPILSTTNTSIQKLLANEPADRLEAVRSRVMSLWIGKIETATHRPVFAAPVPGFDESGRAVRAMRATVDTVYWTAGPTFARWLVDRRSADQTKLCAEIAVAIDGVSRRLKGLAPEADQRHLDMLAIVEVAGELAQRAGVLPSEWGPVTSAVDYVCLALQQVPDWQEQLQGAEWSRFIRFVQGDIAKRKFMPFDARMLPVPTVKAMWPGFVRARQDCFELYVDTEYLKTAFGASRQFLRECRSRGTLLVHGSEGDRYQQHAPTKLRRYGFDRVHVFRLQHSELGHLGSLFREAKRAKLNVRV